MPNAQKAQSLVGIAEADETYFLESFKGLKKDMLREPHKRGSKASKRGLSDEQIPVLICRDRTGSTSDFVLEKADKTHISAVLKPLLASDAVLCTDTVAGRWVQRLARSGSPTARSIWPQESKWSARFTMCRT